MFGKITQALFFVVTVPCSIKRAFPLTGHTPDINYPSEKYTHKSGG